VERAGGVGLVSLTRQRTREHETLDSRLVLGCNCGRLARPNRSRANGEAHDRFYSDGTRCCRTCNDIGADDGAQDRSARECVERDACRHDDERADRCADDGTSAGSRDDDAGSRDERASAGSDDAARERRGVAAPRRLDVRRAPARSRATRGRAQGANP